MTCPLCGADGGVCFDRRERSPILLNRTYKTAAAARAAATGALAITGCEACGFVWNAAFDEKAIVYDAEYENDQAHSPVFRAHMDDMVKLAIAMAPERESLNVVEVGAGQGVFLQTIARAAGERLQSATGFDPAWRGAPGGGPAPARLYADLFDAKAAARLPNAPNLIVSRHTIEHVRKPLAFLRAIRAALPTGATTRLAVETPCVQWILDNWAIQDFFYEHCSLFTAETLKLAFARAGFEPIEVRHVFGGQYLWAEAKATVREEPTRTSSSRLDFHAWAERRAQMFANWNARLEAAAKSGPVYVWGAGAKGVTFASIFDPHNERIAALVDINPNKQGAYAPATGCPITGPGAISGPRATIIVMNPNYRDEIARSCADNGLHPTIITLEVLP